MAPGSNVGVTFQARMRREKLSTTPSADRLGFLCKGAGWPSLDFALMSGMMGSVALAPAVAGQIDTN